MLISVKKDTTLKVKIKGRVIKYSTLIKEIMNLIKLARENWKVILNKKESEKLLKEQPNILKSYYIQQKVFGGIRNKKILFKDINYGTNR